MYEEICYAKPFLKEVIARVDFAAPIASLERTIPARIVKVIMQHFPISEPAEGVHQEWELDSNQVRTRRTAFKQWNYFGIKRDKKISLGSGAIYVTYSKYTKYEEMKAQFGQVLDAFARETPDCQVGRLGLRFINVIDRNDHTDPTNWSELIAPHLLQQPGALSDGSVLTRLMHIAEIRDGEISLRFQYGMPNPDYPAAMKRPTFVLDLDAYVEVAHDIAKSTGHLEQSHALIQNTFERSIKDRLRELMDAKPTGSLSE